MAEQPFTTPVEDTVPKLDGEVAVGEDLDFQRRWWKFERIIWSVFLIVIVCDLLGMFGHGWLAKAKVRAPDGSLTIEYERIERANTPSTMTLHIGPNAIRDGHVKVFVSDSIVQSLGAQRVAPQPAESVIGQGGILYTFLTTTGPAEIQIQLQPVLPGPHSFRIQIPNSPAIEASVFVMP